MENAIFRQLEVFRKKQGLSILALCRQMGVYNHTYHRWKKSGHIAEAYQRIITNFLASKKSSQQNLKNKENPGKSPMDSDIAVIGIGCYYPGAANPKNYGKNPWPPCAI